MWLWVTVRIGANIVTNTVAASLGKTSFKSVRQRHTKSSPST